MSMAINFGRVEIYNEGFSSMKSPDPLITWSYKFMVLQLFSCCITTTTKPIGTKSDKVVTYSKKLQAIKSQPLNK